MRKIKNTKKSTPHPHLVRRGDTKWLEEITEKEFGWSKWQEKKKK